MIDDGIKRSVNISVDATRDRELDMEMMKYQSAKERLEKRMKKAKKALLCELPFLILFGVLILGHVIPHGTTLYKICGWGLCVSFIALSITSSCYAGTVVDRDKLDKIEKKKTPFINISVNNKRRK